MVAPDREKPGISASACAVPTANASRKDDLLRDAHVVVGIGLGRATAEHFGAVEQQPIQSEKDRRRLRRGEDAAQLVLEQQAEDAGGDRADDEQPAELRVGVIRIDAAVPKRAADSFQDPCPVAPEEGEQHERGRKVGRNQEREEVLVVLVDVPAEQPRQDHAVPEARDREQLGDALQEPEDDRPRVRDQRGEDQAVLERFGPVRNQANTKHASPTRNAAMPCFTW